ncbi:gag-polypeptide of LTR copia-type [Sesbania bispinosa]|nr:gag-polypeptide of LTR copia-type [Sesbania bispinosa]
MKTSLCAKIKLGFVDGTIKKPSTTSSEYHAWKRTDPMVIAWIIKSTNATLHGSISRITTARDVWLDLEERFPKMNAPRMHQLWHVLNLIQQEPSMSVTKYYDRFKSLTNELGEMQPLLQCLDSDRYAQIKGTILNIDPLPSLKRVLNHILIEESYILVDKSREVKVDMGPAFHVNNASR